MMVVRHGKTSREQVRQALQRVEAVDGDCIGMVINMAPTTGRGYGYGYGYGYGGYEPDLARRGRRKKESTDKRHDAAARAADSGSEVTDHRLASIREVRRREERGPDTGTA
jgi:receptor protein-tyrosine kinase